MNKLSSIDIDNYEEIHIHIDELDYVAEFNDENFGSFLLEHFGETYEPKPPANISKNKGFSHYIENGEISGKAAWKLLTHPEYERTLKYR